MATRGPLLAVLAMSACEADDPSAVCRGDRPIQLLATEDYYARAETSSELTFVVATSTTSGFGGTFVGPDCGAAPTLTIPSLSLAPARIAVDPDDDDPTIACDTFAGQLYRIDPTGAEPPRLVLPWLRCPGTPTKHGPLFTGNFGNLRAIWLVPEFPDESDAVQVAEAAQSGILVGDRYYFLDRELVVRRVDLRTRASEIVAEGVYLYRATETHALVRSNVDPDVAPMYVIDLATGARAYLGLFHDDEDSGARRIDPAYAWEFDPTGRAVVHTPDAPAPMTAFDLTGAPIAFPAHGRSLLAHPDGTFVIFDQDATIAARPGDPHTVRLDFVDDPATTSAPVVVGDHLELRVDGDLYALPLAGGPRRLLARDIGAVREWLDDEHILTLHDDGRLLTVVAAANLRRSLGTYALSYTWVPGRGVYYTNYAGDGSPANGVWFAPEAALYPRVQPCLGNFWCR